MSNDFLEKRKVTAGAKTPPQNPPIDHFLSQNVAKKPGMVWGSPFSRDPRMSVGSGRQPSHESGYRPWECEFDPLRVFDEP